VLRAIALLLITGLATACTARTAPFMRWFPNPSDKALCEASERALGKPTMLAAPETKQSVSALAFAPDGATLHVVHAGAPGMLIKWEVSAAPQVVQQIALDKVGQRGVQFSAASNRLVVTAGRPDRRSSVNLLGTDLKGVQVWDVASGKLLSHSMNEPDKKPPPTVWADAALSPAGDLVLVATPGGYLMDEVDSGKGRCSVLMITDEQVHEATAVAFDAKGETFAYGNANGDVELWRLGKEPGICPSVGGGVMGDHEEVIIRLAFHPTDNRYAVLSDRSLWIVRWPGFFLDRVKRIERKSSALGDIKFSPDGRLLAVATPHGLEVRKYPSLDVVASDAGISATAVAFSAANCTLAVGDSVGTVRLYELR